MRSGTVRGVALMALAGVALAACGDDEDDAGESATTAAVTTMAETASTEMSETSMASPTTMAEAGTIVEVATAAGDFTTLVAAVEAAGLAETLSGPGPFTVFAPTDEAFAAALESLGLTAEELLADTAMLTDVLTYHVVAGEVPASDVLTMDGESVPTVNGAEVTISVDGETVMVNDATVTATDIAASNGVIHVIDAVLLPPPA
jgi:transforming growth factor-beta-induced protein